MRIAFALLISGAADLLSCCGGHPLGNLAEPSGAFGPLSFPVAADSMFACGPAYPPLTLHSGREVNFDLLCTARRGDSGYTLVYADGSVIMRARSWRVREEAADSLIAGLTSGLNRVVNGGHDCDDRVRRYWKSAGRFILLLVQAGDLKGLPVTVTLVEEPERPVCRH